MGILAGDLERDHRRGDGRAWHALRTGPFWSGVGPGNFRYAYLRYKLPESSEEILDPHNLFLEVWATAGFGAFLALLAALILGLRNLLGPPATPDSKSASRSGRSGPDAPDPSADPRRADRIWTMTG